MDKLKWSREKKIEMLIELMDEAEAENWTEEVKDHIDFLIGLLIDWGEIDNLEVTDLKYSYINKQNIKEYKERAKKAHYLK